MKKAMPSAPRRRPPRAAPTAIPAMAPVDREEDGDWLSEGLVGRGVFRVGELVEAEVVVSFVVCDDASVSPSRASGGKQLSLQ